MEIENIHPLVVEKIKELEQRYPMVEHPLIRGICIRQFNAQQMHLIAERFYHVIRNFPRFIAGMISHWDDTEARMPLVENLFEEHGRMDKNHIHVNTYIDFLVQMGLDIDRIKTSAATPATISYVNSVLTMCTNGHPNQGLGTLGYIEDIVHQVSAIIGMAARQEQNHQQDISHFSEHEILDDQHSKEIYAMLNMTSQADIEAALHGLTMGAYFHHQLYESILAEILYETGATRPEITVRPERTRSQAAYPLKTGEAGKQRLDILGRLYNPASLEFIAKQTTQKNLQVLEFGCGTGKFSHEISEHFPTWDILSLDNSEAQIDLAQAQWSSPRLRFQTGDIDDLQAMGQQFDVIYLRWVLIYQKDIEKYIEAFSHHLNDGGLLIIEDNEPGNSGCFSPTHQTNIDNWENFWTQATTFVGSGPGFSLRICEAAKSYGLELRDVGINQQLLTTKSEKEVFALGIVESKDAILEAGLMKKVYEEIRDNAAAISDSEIPVGFVRNFQLCFSRNARA